MASSGDEAWTVPLEYKTLPMSKVHPIQAVIESYIADLLPPDPMWPASVRDAVQCIHSRFFHQELTVHEVKRICRIRKRRFSGFFEFYVGKGLKAYIDYHRREAAKMLLLRGGIKITHVALAVGFSTTEALTMSFQRHEGCAPSEFVRQNVKQDLKRNVGLNNEKK